MTLTPLPVWSDAEMAEFETECFRSWLNRIDARITYDIRRKYAAVEDWRLLFDDGHSESSAIRQISCL